LLVLLRITGGRFQGRTLRALRGRTTRPTAARVRESIFNVLEHSPRLSFALKGSCVVDLYAGSGALGLESLSRGASRVALVEKNRRVAEVIKRNISHLEVGDRCRVVCAPVTKALQTFERESAVFDLVFMDPPYSASSERAKVMELLARSSILASDGLLVVEGPAADRSDLRAGTSDRSGDASSPSFPSQIGLEVAVLRTWGDTQVRILRHVQSSRHLSGVL
jgi:16S rRNA (guanine(966)-N(2))-methyltransferase RsmD